MHLWAPNCRCLSKCKLNAHRRGTVWMHIGGGSWMHWSYLEGVIGCHYCNGPVPHSIYALLSSFVCKVYKSFRVTQQEIWYMSKSPQNKQTQIWNISVKCGSAKLIASAIDVPLDLGILGKVVEKGQGGPSSSTPAAYQPANKYFRFLLCRSYGFPQESVAMDTSWG